MTNCDRISHDFSSQQYLIIFVLCNPKVTKNCKFRFKFPPDLKRLTDNQLTLRNIKKLLYPTYID